MKLREEEVVSSSVMLMEDSTVQGIGILMCLVGQHGPGDWRTNVPSATNVFLM